MENQIEEFKSEIEELKRIVSKQKINRENFDSNVYCLVPFKLVKDLFSKNANFSSEIEKYPTFNLNN